MLKNLESAGKNKFEKTAPKRDDSRTYLNGVDTTRGSNPAKYGGLVRPKNNSQVDRKLTLYVSRKFRFELRREKPGLRGFRPGLTQIGLYSHRKRLEA